MKKLLLLIILFISLTIIISIIIKKPLSPSNKIQIVSSFYPLGKFAKQVGGDKVHVIIITPPGAEPHDYEPTPQDIVKIYNSKLFIYNGSGIDPWAEKLAPDLIKKNIKVIKAIDLIPENERINNDPHFWLDPILNEKIINTIFLSLTQIDPVNTSFYQQNLLSSQNSLNSLNELFITSFKTCQKHEIIVSHNAFSYLGRRYGIKINYLAGVSPDQEPSAQRLAQLSVLAKEKNIRYIYFETLVNPKIAETLATEINAKTLVLNPIEGLTTKQINQGENYFSLMKENLKNLKTGLNCR